MHLELAHMWLSTSVGNGGWEGNDVRKGAAELAAAAGRDECGRKQVWGKGGECYESLGFTCPPATCLL